MTQNAPKSSEGTESASLLAMNRAVPKYMKQAPTVNRKKESSTGLQGRSPLILDVGSAEAFKLLSSKDDFGLRPPSQSLVCLDISTHLLWLTSDILAGLSTSSGLPELVVQACRARSH
ncbi:hypothetical protein OIY81_3161 [Cryptosporidium canis]|uniref:Uncharacterized protein n=1 Tax=Cryptosporidium canis TaxID=195482 RepID=A0ABQ8P2X3_9CRYT|nr:hypothetical protein OJ252_3362 [Cryptosporidium canis]KAJ1606591.1 hypothetical protein OIY81_3161 [Cryptosporidium canis]